MSERDTTPSRARLVTMGETMAVFSTDERWRTRGSTVLRSAGAESNVAIVAARLGAPSTWIGRVGSGGLAERLIADLAAEGVTVCEIPDPGVPSLLLKERRLPDGPHIQYVRERGPGSRLSPADLEPALLADAALLHVTGVTPALSRTARDAVFAALALGRDVGSAISFDVNYRSRLWDRAEAGPVLRALAEQADILFIGDDEVDVLFEGRLSGPEAAGYFVDRGVREVVLKQGGAGALAFSDGRVVQQEAFIVDVVDPVGAGDAFAGGYLAERLRGEPIGLALRTGAVCGAFAVRSAGDWEGAPTRRDVQEFLAHGGTSR
ncbi:sugar kinase [Leifsonia sp. AG29]|uniref:sugar kinase n=1 Tax=Leifsonia sp. AG29 TaxID=2598860 RepID=UPI00131ACC07|nr:sugar kinase [Leifsonia sp. AG29]